MCLTEESKQKYREFLEKLAKNKSKELFSNGGKDHAIVLYQVLLDHASGEVHIFCEEGVSEIWQDEGVKKALLNYLAKDGSKLKILVENAGNAGFAEVREKYYDRVEVQHVSQQGLNIIHEHFDNRNCNFAVFDPNMFRYEYDKQGYKAYGSFNDEEISKSMIALFNRVWIQDSQPQLENFGF